MFKSYLTIALRNIRRQKAFSIINITGLAIGMACCILILLWVQDELDYDTFHSEGDRIYRLIKQAPDDKGITGGSTLPYALVPLLKNEFPEIDTFTRYQDRTWLESSTFATGDKKFYETGLYYADPSFFEIFSFSFLEGDPKTALKDPDSLVITRDIARKYFGEEKVLGRVLRYNNRRDLRVTAVLENLPHNTHFQFELMASIHLLGEKKLATWHWESSSYVRLQPNVDITELRMKIAGSYTRLAPYEAPEKMNLQPVTKIHLHQGRGDIRLVYIFSAVAFFILIIACINFMNLATARSMKRAREVGLRKVVGARRTQLMRQFFGEAMLMAFTAVLLAMLLVTIFLKPFNTITSKPLSINIFGNPLLLLGLVALTAVVGLISGSYPALFLSGFQPIRVLKSGFRGHSGGTLFRKGLVILQFSISLILIIGTIIVSKQLHFIQNKDLGWDRQDVIVIPINKELREQFQVYRNELTRNPNIRHITAASSSPTSIGNVNPVEWVEGKEEDLQFLVKFIVAQDDYLDTFGIKLASGRDFSRERQPDLSNFIVNQEAVRALNLEPPLNRQIKFMRGKGEIIGVMEDFNFRHMTQRIQPLIMTVHPDLHAYFLQHIFVRINRRDIPKTIAYIKDVTAEYAPNYPFKYKFVDEDFNNMYIYERYVARLANIFTIIALFIACLGLFGLASFITEQRTKEIGVRKVLGATVPGITMLLTNQFSKWVILANLLSWPLAYFAMNKWLSNYAYRIPLSWWIFPLAGALALLIAFLTVSYQAIRAARANPADALHYE